MQATADSLAFAPPREPAAVRGFFLAALAHILLIAALTWGINWDKETQPAAVEAELWSALPQEAAPPPPPPAPAPAPEPVVKAPPVVQPPPQPVEKAPDINIEREKKRKQEEARRHEEEERKRLEAQKRKVEEQKRLADEKKQREELAKKEKLQEQRKQELEARKREQLRKEQIARMQSLAAGTGSPTSQGTAQRSSGPSDSWSGRIQRAVYPNIVFTGHADGKLRVGVEIRLAPDGTVVGEPVVREPSGNPAWDDAVVRGIKKTGILPRDVDGRVFSPALIGFTRER